MYVDDVPAREYDDEDPSIATNGEPLSLVLDAIACLNELIVSSVHLKQLLWKAQGRRTVPMPRATAMMVERL